MRGFLDASSVIILAVLITLIGFGIWAVFAPSEDAAVRTRQQYIHPRAKAPIGGGPEQLPTIEAPPSNDREQTRPHDAGEPQKTAPRPRAAPPPGQSTGQDPAPDNGASDPPDDQEAAYHGNPAPTDQNSQTDTAGPAVRLPPPPPSFAEEAQAAQQQADQAEQQAQAAEDEATAAENYTTALEEALQEQSQAEQEAAQQQQEQQQVPPEVPQYNPSTNRFHYEVPTLQRPAPVQAPAPTRPGEHVEECQNWFYCQ